MMRHPEFPVASGLVVLLLLLPFRHQLRVRNVAVLVGMSSLISTSVVYFVNTLVWAGNVRDVAPIWCDISTNISFYAQMSVGTAALCLCLQFEWISSPRSSRASRPNRVWFEVALCCIFPLVSIPIRYAVSTNRYLIMEDFGCIPAFYPSIITTVVVFIPEVIIGFIAFVFACIAIRNFVLRQISITGTLRSALITPRLIRILASCLIIGTWTALAITVVLYYQIQLPHFPWLGWDAIHASFSHILLLPKIAQPPAFRQLQIVMFWIYAASGYMSFVILASGEDFQKECRCVWEWIKEKCGVRRSVENSTSDGEQGSSKWTKLASLDDRSKNISPQAKVDTVDDVLDIYPRRMSFPTSVSV